MSESTAGTTEVECPPCFVCGKINTVVMRLDSLRRWQSGEFIQQAAPELTPGVREMLISGTCEKCFDDTFPDEDKDDYS